MEAQKTETEKALIDQEKAKVEPEKIEITWTEE